MENTVRSFNGLRRPKITSTSLPNHWVFGVRKTPFTPPGDLVLAVNPQSRFLLTGGRRQILLQSTISEKAKAVIGLLLDMFIKGIDPEGRYPNVPPPFAPWTWVAEDPELGAAIEKGLKQYGVKKELCRVGACSAEDKLILEESLSRHRALLGFRGCCARRRLQVPRVRKKQRGLLDAAQEVLRVLVGLVSFAGLPEVPLEGAQAGVPRQPPVQIDERQAIDRKLGERKPGDSNSVSTDLPSVLGSAFPSLKYHMAAHTHYNEVAHTSPEGQALITSLGLDYPPVRTKTEDLNKALRRLVLSGQDTPDKLKLLFGPEWRASQGKEHEDARMEILLDPPRGSPSYVFMRSWNKNRGPERAPRPATDAEQRRITLVRDMQEKIRQRVGAGKKPSDSDMQVILKSYGHNWTEHMETYQLAADTMKQGL
ncbi:hypothetical protein CPLU01_13039 [Colletotrichum plurivorum]|uniref:Uncharacterized protein n=1 Tax=Colletotrichum plurivorum TaxID=2175906 RepID=A0A8H6JU60_9PEZI|nr:hypothetical protein CPLU01_13039 [Colletotrichum plurivorum]